MGLGPAIGRAGRATGMAMMGGGGAIPIDGSHRRSHRRSLGFCSICGDAGAIGDGESLNGESLNGEKSLAKGGHVGFFDAKS
jgi:hypothetical protein